MSEVISIKQFKKKSAKKKSSAHLDSYGVEMCAQMLDLQISILEQLHLETENFLKQLHLPLHKFTLDDESAREYVSTDLFDAFSGGDEMLCLSYIAHMDKTEYRTLAFADIDGDDVGIYVDLYKKSGKEWLVYAGNGVWEQGPGEDFF